MLEISNIYMYIYIYIHIYIYIYISILYIQTYINIICLYVYKQIASIFLLYFWEAPHQKGLLTGEVPRCAVQEQTSLRGPRSPLHDNQQLVQLLNSQQGIANRE